jgi:hypothetical protein
MSAKVITRTANDFRAAHDPDVIIPNKIRAALAELAKGGEENWEYELEFSRRAGVNQQQLAAYRPQFEAHVVVAPGRNTKRAWFASTKVAKKLRGE